MTPYSPPTRGILKDFLHTVRRKCAYVNLALWNPVQITITGSQGKTALTQALYNILKEIRPTVASDMNLDTAYNTPITALHVTPSTQYVLFELGVDRLGEMDYHLQIVRPYVSVVTGVSASHTDREHLGSIENLYKEKAKLASATGKDGVCILNISDDYVRKMATLTKARVLSYGRFEDRHLAINPDDAILYKDVKVHFEGTSFTLVDVGLQKEFQIKTRLIGAFHAQTISATYAILKTLNPYFVWNFDKSVSEILRPLPGRMSYEVLEGYHILNDSLRANPTSTAEGLKTFADIPYAKGGKVAILADMAELDDPEKRHRMLADVASTLPIDTYILIGRYQKIVFEKLSQMPSVRAFHFDTTQEAKKHLLDIISPNDFMYLKGSLKSRVFDLFEGAKH